MNNARRKRIQESALVLTEALEQIGKIHEEEVDILDRMPDTEEYEAERLDQEGIVEYLEEAISGLEDAIEMLSDAGFAGSVFSHPKKSLVQAPERDNELPVPETLPATPPDKERELGLIGWLAVCAIPFSVAAPLIIVFTIFYLGNGDTIFLVLSIACFALALFFVFLSARKLKEPVTPSEERTFTAGEDDSDQDQASTLFMGMLGGYFLGKSLHKNKQSFADKTREDIFWQERYRRHDDDYDGDDW